MAKIEKFGIFRGNFPNPYPNQRWLTQPDPSNKNLTRPGSKFFDLDLSLVNSEKIKCGAKKINLTIFVI